MTATALPAPCQNVVSAETALASAHVAVLTAYVDNAPAFDLLLAPFTSDRQAAKALGLSTSTLSRWRAAFDFVTDIADAHGPEVLALIVGADLTMSLRSYDSVTVLRDAAAQIVRASDPLAAAESAFRPMREACAARNARVKTANKAARTRQTVTTADALSPVAFLSETLRQARVIVAGVGAGKVNASDEDTAEILALAADLGPVLAQIVALAGSEEAPTLGTVPTV